MVLVPHFSLFSLLLFILFKGHVTLSLQHAQSPKVVKPNMGKINKIPMVQKNPAKKITVDLTNAKYENAKCLDGTPGGYYYSPGLNPEGQKRFYIYRMGGAFCSNFDECLSRSRGPLGSTSDDHWPKEKDLTNPDDGHLGFSRDTNINPLMWTWNHVYIIYCDGSYFAGSNSTQKQYKGKPLFFHGGDIQSAILYDLKAKHGFDKSLEVVVGGCSAGGISTYMTVDHIFAHPAAPKGALTAALACSGYFLNDEETYTSHKQFSYQVHNMSGMMSRDCLRDNRDEPHRCVVSEVSAPYVVTPLFIWESKFDSYRLKHTYVNCMGADCANKASLREFVSLMKLQSQGWTTGIFLTGCMHHCDDAETGDIANIRPIRGDIPLVAFYKWYDHQVRKRWKGLRFFVPRIWNELVKFPCEKCCPAKHKHQSWLHDLE